MSEHTAQDRPSDILKDRPSNISLSTGTSGRAQKQKPEVIVTRMASSSPVPDLSSASPSSISSVDTRSGSGYGFGPAPVSGPGRNGIYVFDESGMAPIISDQTLSRTLSWGTTPSISSASPSLSISVSSVRTYACLFHMLDCHESFDDPAEWRTHIFSHFRAHPTPPTARCPMCANTTFVDADADEKDDESITPSAWDQMLDHVAEDHFRNGQGLAGSRPDFELMRYLYGMRIITDAQFKAMQLPPAPSSPAYHRSQDGVRASIGSADEPYCAPYSKRREERMRGQQRGVGVV
jgi:hypothetical protein